MYSASTNSHQDSSVAHLIRIYKFPSPNTCFNLLIIIYGCAPHYNMQIKDMQPGKTTRLTARSRDTLWRSVLISPFCRQRLWANVEIFKASADGANPINEMRRCETTGTSLRDICSVYKFPGTKYMCAHAQSLHPFYCKMPKTQHPYSLI
jgi:hypothetical protein